MTPILLTTYSVTSVQMALGDVLIYMVSLSGDEATGLYAARSYGIACLFNRNSENFLNFMLI